MDKHTEARLNAFERDEKNLPSTAQNTQDRPKTISIGSVAFVSWSVIDPIGLVDREQFDCSWGNAAHTLMPVEFFLMHDLPAEVLRALESLPNDLMIDLES